MLVLKFYIKAFTILSFASLCISSSCSKSVSNKYMEDIKGTWILKQKSGGFAGRTTTPDKITKLIFEDDAKYSTSYDNQTTDKGTYTITKASPSKSYNSDTLLKLFSNNNNDTLIYGMHSTEDSLYLDEGCCDRFAYTYIRQK